MSIVSPPEDRLRGWITATLAEIGTLYCGQSPESKHVNVDGNGTIYVSGPEQWNGHEIEVSKWTTQPKRVVPDGCVFITVKGAGVGTIFPGIPCAIGRDIYAFKPAEGLSSQFVELALRHTVQQFLRHAVGDIPGLSKAHILSHAIGIPPAQQQTAIAEKLDELFSRIEKGEENLKRVQALVKRYRQAVLKAAVTGELTRDWREQNGGKGETGAELLQRILASRRAAWEKAERAKMKAKGKKPKDDRWKQNYKEPEELDTTELPRLPAGWVWSCIDHIAEAVGGVTVDAKRKTEDGRPVAYLRVANVQRGYLDLSEIKTVTVPEGAIQKLALRVGDILFNEGGDRDKLGRGWIWNGEIDECIHQNHVFRARPYLDSLPSRFISMFGNELGREYFMDQGKQTTNLASISLTKLKALPIPVPPLAEMVAATELAEALISDCDAVERQVAAAVRQSLALRQSTLRAAFSGDLVPQDLNDEPAAVLLEQIAAERRSGGASKRSRGRSEKGNAMPAQEALS